MRVFALGEWLLVGSTLLSSGLFAEESRSRFGAETTDLCGWVIGESVPVPYAAAPSFVEITKDGFVPGYASSPFLDVLFFNPTNEPRNLTIKVRNQNSQLIASHEYGAFPPGRGKLTDKGRYLPVVNLIPIEKYTFDVIYEDVTGPTLDTPHVTSFSVSPLDQPLNQGEMWTPLSATTQVSTAGGGTLVEATGLDFNGVVSSGPVSSATSNVLHRFRFKMRSPNGSRGAYMAVGRTNGFLTSGREWTSLSAQSSAVPNAEFRPPTGDGEFREYDVYYLSQNSATDQFVDTSLGVRLLDSNDGTPTKTDSGSLEIQEVTHSPIPVDAINWMKISEWNFSETPTLMVKRQNSAQQNVMSHGLWVPSSTGAWYERELDNPLRDICDARLSGFTYHDDAPSFARRQNRLVLKGMRASWGIENLLREPSWNTQAVGIDDTEVHLPGSLIYDKAADKTGKLLRIDLLVSCSERGDAAPAFLVTLHETMAQQKVPASSVQPLAGRFGWYKDAPRVSVNNAENGFYNGGAIFDYYCGELRGADGNPLPANTVKRVTLFVSPLHHQLGTNGAILPKTLNLAVTLLEATSAELRIENVSVSEALIADLPQGTDRLDLSGVSPDALPQNLRPWNEVAFPFPQPSADGRGSSRISPVIVNGARTGAYVDHDVFKDNEGKWTIIGKYESAPDGPIMTSAVGTPGSSSHDYGPWNSTIIQSRSMSADPFAASAIIHNPDRAPFPDVVQSATIPGYGFFADKDMPLPSFGPWAPSVFKDGTNRYYMIYREHSFFASSGDLPYTPGLRTGFRMATSLDPGEPGKWDAAIGAPSVQVTRLNDDVESPTARDLEVLALPSSQTGKRTYHATWAGFPALAAPGVHKDDGAVMYKRLESNMVPDSDQPPYNAMDPTSDSESVLCNFGPPEAGRHDTMFESPQLLDDRARGNFYLAFTCNSTNHPRGNGRLSSDTSSGAMTLPPPDYLSSFLALDAGDAVTGEGNGFVWIVSEESDRTKFWRGEDGNGDLKVARPLDFVLTAQDEYQEVNPGITLDPAVSGAGHYDGSGVLLDAGDGLAKPALVAFDLLSPHREIVFGRGIGGATNSWIRPNSLERFRTVESSERGLTREKSWYLVCDEGAGAADGKLYLIEGELETLKYRSPGALARSVISRTNAVRGANGLAAGDRTLLSGLKDPIALTAFRNRGGGVSAHGVMTDTINQQALAAMTVRFKPASKAFGAEGNGHRLMIRPVVEEPVCSGDGPCFSAASFGGVTIVNIQGNPTWSELAEYLNGSETAFTAEISPEFAARPITRRAQFVDLFGGRDQNVAYFISTNTSNGIQQLNYVDVSDPAAVGTLGTITFNPALTSGDVARDFVVRSVPTGALGATEFSLLVNGAGNTSRLYSYPGRGTVVTASGDALLGLMRRSTYAGNQELLWSSRSFRVHEESGASHALLLSSPGFSDDGFRDEVENFAVVRTVAAEHGRNGFGRNLFAGTKVYWLEKDAYGNPVPPAPSHFLGTIPVTAAELFAVGEKWYYTYSQKYGGPDSGWGVDPLVWFPTLEGEE